MMEADKILFVIDLIGIVAFSLTGAILAIRKGLDLFGVNILAVINAVGGGCIRDIMLGNTPPVMLTNPLYIVISSICATLLFVLMYFHLESNDVNKKQAFELYEKVLFVFDTLGLASFTIGGFLIAYKSLEHPTIFIGIFMGVMTGIGGGILRDVTLQRLPSVFVKHIYALASIAGAFVCGILMQFMNSTVAGIIGFIVIFIIRCLAAKFKWDLPVVKTNA